MRIKKMGNFITFSLSVLITVIFISCNSELTPTSCKVTIETLSYVYNGNEYPVNFHVSGNDAVPVKDENYNYVQSILEEPESGFWLDPTDNSKYYLYANNQESETAYKSIVKNSSLEKVASDRPRYMEIHLYNHINYDGDLNYGYNVDDDLTKPYNINDCISSIKVFGARNSAIKFWEHPGYGGHSFGMVCLYLQSNGTYGDFRSDLRSWQMTSTRNWNDRISSYKQEYY